MKRMSRRELLAGVSAAGASLTMAGSAAGQAKQPHMVAALQALQTAERELKEALPDKGGFRAKAIENVKEAIGNVQKGIDFARR